MSDVIVYSTSTEQVQRKRRERSIVATIHAAASKPQRPTYGACMGCGAVEVALVRVVGHRDLSRIGESSCYPIGHECELCA